MSTFIGIDLGTTFSVVAHLDRHGRPAVLLNALGKPITPSVINFATDPPTVGEEAKAAQAAGESRIASFFKRYMGDALYAFEDSGKVYTPVDLSAIVLRQLKADAEARLGQTVTHAVITVPAYFNNAQREATIKAGERVGLTVLRIINEPTAAALAYGVQPGSKAEDLLVYDLGGGTFDVTVVRVTADSIDVLATDGDFQLGGKDWDDSIARYVAARFQAEHGIDPLDDTAGFNDLLVRVETAKKALSSRTSVSVAIHHGGIRASYELTREQFEEQTAGLMERTQRLTEQTLAEAKLTWAGLGGVLLVGGSTRMPMVHRYVEQMSGKPPRTGVNVDEAVALGAALQAAIDMQTIAPSKVPARLPGQKRIQDVMSHSLGLIVEAADRSRYINSIIIEKNKPIPASFTRPYQLRTRSRGENILEVYVTQGETESPTTCSFVNKYKFSDIKHVSGGPAVLEIRYDYDRNGVVVVSATERASGRKLPLQTEAVPTDMSWVTRPPEQATVASHMTAYLAFDLSGSMSGEPLAEAQRAACEFVTRIDLAHNSLGVISFADSVTTSSSACQDARKLNKAIGGMSIGSVGYGNGASPFAHTHKLLRGVDDPRYIIVLTDGVWSDQDKAAQEARACHADGIEVIAIGFGGADLAFLQRISTSEAGAFLTDLGGLVETFSTIAQAITDGSGLGHGG